MSKNLEIKVMPARERKTVRKIERIIERKTEIKWLRLMQNNKEKKAEWERERGGERKTNKDKSIESETDR
jgi:hypothetical protein